MIVQYNEIKVEWDIIAKKMEDKYGQVNVNLNDGSVSPIDPSANPLGYILYINILKKKFYN